MDHIGIDVHKKESQIGMLREGASRWSSARACGRRVLYLAFWERYK